MSGQILLGSLLTKLYPNYPSNLNDNEKFEFYCAENLLINFDLTHSEIADGIVDGGKDGGVDSIYCFVNRNLVNEDTDFTSFKQPVEIELYIIQAKDQDSFKETPLDALCASLPLLLDANLDRDALKASFKSAVVDKTTRFLDAMKELGGEFPSVNVRIFYCSRGTSPNDTVLSKRTSLKSIVETRYSNVDVSVLGAQSLYDRSGTQKRLVKDLPTVGSPLSGTTSYVTFCKITDYAGFIADTDGSLITRIFDANVRAYQGEVEVNKEISDSLRNPSGTDFWWLNNGVTVVADNAQYHDGKLTIENPLIVNGLQTSHEIYNATSVLTNDDRMVLVRVIVEKDQDKRDAIIRATNRQTGIKHSSFRATEPIHKQIEDYLSEFGYFYDRRKNLYKREGKPADRIIGIDRLAQGVVALLLQQPHNSRARPTTVIKKDADYEKIFSNNRSTHPLEMYGRIVDLLFRVDNYFKSHTDTISQTHRNNLRFHVLMVLGWALNENQTLPAPRIVQLDMTKVTDARLESVGKWVFSEFDAAGGLDKTAKDSAFTARLKTNWTVDKT